MWCEILKIGGITRTRCQQNIAMECPACVECTGVALTDYPERLPNCACGRAGNHPSVCAHRQRTMETGRPASVKEQIYVAAVLDGESKPQAMATAGFPPSMQTAKAARALEASPPVKELMEDVLNKKGVTRELLAQKLREGLEANKQIIRVNEKNGIVVDREVPDHDNRAKYLRMGLEVHNAFPKQGQDAPTGNIVIVNKLSLNISEEKDTPVRDVTP